MEQPLPALVFQIFGFAISILALLAESHSQNDVNSPATPSLVSPPPPSPHLPNPLPPPPSHRLRPPSPPPQDRRQRKSNNGSNYGPRKLPPPPPEKTINTGKKIGLLFVGIAAILQIGVVGFLAFKRRQLLMLRDGYVRDLVIITFAGCVRRLGKKEQGKWLQYKMNSSADNLFDEKP